MLSGHAPFHTYSVHLTFVDSLAWAGLPLCVASDSMLALQANKRLLATCYFRADQPHRAYDILRGAASIHSPIGKVRHVGYAGPVSAHASASPLHLWHLCRRRHCYGSFARRSHRILDVCLKPQILLSSPAVEKKAKAIFKVATSETGSAFTNHMYRIGGVKKKSQYLISWTVLAEQLCCKSMTGG